MKRGKNGFTMAELLIVVAIIAVLTAVAIPVFTSQLKKARLAVDHSAMRDAYALVQIANNVQQIEVDGTTYSFDDLKQKQISTGKKVYFLLAEDCNRLMFNPDSESLVVAPAGSYVFKESGCDETNEFICEVCKLWGGGGYHYKGVGINLLYDSTENLIVFY